MTSPEREFFSNRFQTIWIIACRLVNKMVAMDFFYSKVENPALDWTGKEVYENQDRLPRSIFMPNYEVLKKHLFVEAKLAEGKAIFMPIINWISIMNDDGESDKQLLEIARKRMDVVGPLEITINGITINSGLEKYRDQSTFFEIDLPRNNLFDIQSGKRRCVSDGYWLFLHHPIYNNLDDRPFIRSSGVTRIKVNYTAYHEEIVLDGNLLVQLNIEIFIENSTYNEWAIN